MSNPTKESLEIADQTFTQILDVFAGKDVWSKNGDLFKDGKKYIAKALDSYGKTQFERARAESQQIALRNVKYSTAHDIAALTYELPN